MSKRLLLIASGLLLFAIPETTTNCVPPYGLVDDATACCFCLTACWSAIGLFKKGLAEPIATETAQSKNEIFPEEVRLDHQIMACGARKTSNTEAMVFGPFVNYLMRLRGGRSVFGYESEPDSDSEYPPSLQFHQFHEKSE